ncbi:hypothetical protein SFR_5220 [Streptomyces sp. FR-008]|nr:hypothetical protein SFR_5220 [Streptomyces sp. FR-008]
MSGGPWARPRRCRRREAPAARCARGCRGRAAGRRVPPGGRRPRPPARSAARCRKECRGGIPRPRNGRRKAPDSRRGNADASRPE